jgi:hypothetical protein
MPAIVSTVVVVMNHIWSRLVVTASPTPAIGSNVRSTS